MIRGRSLTGLERWAWLFDRASIFNFVFVVHLEERLDPNRLEVALEQLAQRYPILRSRVSEGRIPRFAAGAGTIDLRCERWEEGAWRAEAVGEVGKRLPYETGPLVRAVLLEGSGNSDLILTLNHVVADGGGGWVLVDDLLDLYARPAVRIAAAPEVGARPLRALLAPRREAIRLAARTARQMRQMVPMPIECEAPLAERSTGLIDHSLTQEETQALRVAARSNGTTVHGAISAAAMLAVAGELRRSKAQRSVCIGCASPVDLRRAAGLDARAVGNLISGVISHAEIDAETPFWSVARSVSTSIRESIDSGAILALARLQDMTATTATRNRRRLLTTAQRYNRAAVYVTNLTSVDENKRSSDLHVRRIRLLASSHGVAGAALGVCVITTGGTLSLNFVHCVPLLSTATAQRLADDAVGRLHDAVDRFDVG